jgi:hypothetical protein
MKISAATTLGEIDAWLVANDLRLYLTWDLARGRYEAILRVGGDSPTAVAWGYGDTVVAAIAGAWHAWHAHNAADAGAS